MFLSIVIMLRDASVLEIFRSASTIAAPTFTTFTPLATLLILLASTCLVVTIARRIVGLIWRLNKNQPLIMMN